MLRFRPRRLTVGIIACAVVGAPLVAGAQSVIPAIEPGARVQDVDLTGSVLYDSNVTGTSAALAAQRGLNLSDIVVSPGVHFDLARPIGRETVYLQGSAGYDFHLKNSILNRESLDIRPGVLGQFGRCQTGLGGDYTRAQSDLAELALTPAGLPSPIQEQNVLEVKQIAVNASCGTAAGLAPNVSVSETWTSNSSVIEQFTNSKTFSVSGGIGYRRPVLGSISLFGSYSHTDYPDRSGALSLAVGSLADAFETVSGGVTYTRSIGSRLQGTASVSFTKLSTSGTTRPGFQGITYSGGLTYQASTRLQFSGNINRATTPSNRLNSTYSIEELYSGRASYLLSRRITVSTGASLAHNTYDGVPFPLGFDLTDEKIYTVYGDVTLQLNRRISLDLNVEHLQRNANFPGLSYPDTRVGLTARARF